MWFFYVVLALLCLGPDTFGATSHSADMPAFPPALESYGDADLSLLEKIKTRAAREPLNVAATILFLCALIHTFLAPKIMHVAHEWRDKHAAMLAERRQRRQQPEETEETKEVSFKAEIAHFFGEVEAIFGIWVVPLMGVFFFFKDWPTLKHYVSEMVQYTEPMFVVVVMAIAATRPILLAAEKMMTLVARLGGGGPAASWFSILTVGPLLGSFITEPAAMTISALLLSRRFFDASPRPVFAYATLGLLFVNVSIGGTLTHFAAPPVLMVAGTWNWGLEHMVLNFGWKAALAVVASNILYYAWFRRDFRDLQPVESGGQAAAVPIWITVVHLLFLAWTVFTAHYPALFIGGFLFFLAFTTATEHHQSPVVLRPALLVGFFLAGLVIHGGLQSWWIAPVIESLAATPLFFGSVVLTAFNDNAAITFLASLVPDLSDAMKYAVVAGAVTGGGLTVIANAPNPAGQAILSKHFADGVSPLRLLLGAAVPTAMAALVFLMFR